MTNHPAHAPRSVLPRNTAIPEALALAAPTLVFLLLGIALTASAWADQQDFTPEADTYIAQDSPDANKGALDHWGVSLSTPQSPYGGTTYLRFNVNLPAGATISDARLLVVCKNASADTGGTIRKFNPSNPAWLETQPTWNSPLQGSDDPASVPWTQAPVALDQPYEFPGLGSAITGNGQVTFKLTSGSDDGAKYYSKEYGNSQNPPDVAKRPKLRIIYALPLPAVAAPVISPAGALFGSTLQVTLSTATVGAVIRYTLDGSTPTKDTASVYTAPITLNADATLKARAFKSGMADSAIAIASFSKTSAASQTITKPANQHSARSSGWFDSSGGTGNEVFTWSPPQWLEYPVSLSTAGNWTFALTAKNQTNASAPGLPAGYAYSIDVAVDGVYRTTFSVPGSTTAWQTGTSGPVNLGAGTHTVRFTWTNDVYQAGVYDSNIRVLETAFNGPPAAAAFALISPAHNALLETGGSVAIQFAGGSLTGALQYQLLLDSQILQDWSATVPAAWAPAAQDLGVTRTLTLKRRVGATGTPETDSSDVRVIRVPVSHP